MFKGFILTLVLFFSFHSSAANVCSAVFSGQSYSSHLRFENLIQWEKRELSGELAEQTLGENKSFSYTYLKSDRRKKFQEQDLFNDTSDVIIGIDSSGYTQGHVYMIVNNKRVDGHILYTAHTEKIKNWSLSDGLFVRIKNLPEKNKKKLLDWANSDIKMRGMTCVAVACRILFDQAKLSKKPKGDFWFPSEILGLIVNDGLYGSKKQKLDIEIYTFNEKAEEVLKNLPTWSTLPNLFFMLFDPKTWGF